MIQLANNLACCAALLSLNVLPAVAVFECRMTGARTVGPCACERLSQPKADEPAYTAEAASSCCASTTASDGTPPASSDECNGNNPALEMPCCDITVLPCAAVEPDISVRVTKSGTHSDETGSVPFYHFLSASCPNVLNASARHSSRFRSINTFSPVYDRQSFLCTYLV